MFDIENIYENALVDMGSMITAISEKFYNQNKQKFNKCPLLPLSGQIVRSAIN